MMTVVWLLAVLLCLSSWNCGVSSFLLFLLGIVLFFLSCCLSSWILPAALRRRQEVVLERLVAQSGKG
jgi:hypothetical protein